MTSVYNYLEEYTQIIPLVYLHLSAPFIHPSNIVITEMLLLLRDSNKKKVLQYSLSYIFAKKQTSKSILKTDHDVYLQLPERIDHSIHLVHLHLSVPYNHPALSTQMPFSLQQKSDTKKYVLQFCKTSSQRNQKRQSTHLTLKFCIIQHTQLSN